MPLLSPRPTRLRFRWAPAAFVISVMFIASAPTLAGQRHAAQALDCLATAEPRQSVHDGFGDILRAGRPVNLRQAIFDSREIENRANAFAGNQTSTFGGRDQTDLAGAEPARDLVRQR